jgi:cohesin loading factor subunit SCC2
VIVGMLMLLKTYLKSLYGISEEYVLFTQNSSRCLPCHRKCSKFVIGKKSTIGDRAAAKRHDHPINWDRMPFAGASLVTSEDAITQKIRVSNIFTQTFRR